MQNWVAARAEMVLVGGSSWGATLRSAAILVESNIEERIASGVIWWVAESGRKKKDARPFSIAAKNTKKHKEEERRLEHVCWHFRVFLCVLWSLAGMGFSA